MNGAEQLKLWMEGTSLHNDETDECCPDFSCCAPELQAPDEERTAFCAAWSAGDVAGMERLLGVFKERGDAFAAARRAAEVARAPMTGDIMKELPL